MFWTSKYNCMCYLKPKEQFVLICFCWCVVSSTLCSEPWGYPLQTIRLKTASWPWQRANWDCRSTPVCWNMPSWSGDWGESLDPRNPMLPSERSDSFISCGWMLWGDVCITPQPHSFSSFLLLQPLHWRRHLPVPLTVGSDKDHWECRGDKRVGYRRRIMCPNWGKKNNAAKSSA